MHILDFTDWHSNKPTPCLLCLSTWQRRREELRVLSRDCGNFWSQQVWRKTRGQAFGFTPTGGSYKRKGLMRRLRGRLYWCNSGLRRSATEFTLWNMGVSGGCHFLFVQIKTAVCISILSMNSPEGWTAHTCFAWSMFQKVHAKTRSSECLCDSSVRLVKTPLFRLSCFYLLPHMGEINRMWSCKKGG